MPLFKLSKVNNAGQILISVGVDGESLAPASGDISLSGLVTVFGQQESAKGTGNIIVGALLSGQSLASAEGDISLRVVIDGYSTGVAQYTGRANLLFYPYSFIVLSGDAILNGAATGSILVRSFVLSGREGAHGDILVRRPILNGFGSRRVGNGNIIQRVVLSGQGASTYEAPRSGIGELILPLSILSGKGVLDIPVLREGGGSLLLRVVAASGYGRPPVTEAADAIIRYESRRRFI